MSEDAINEKTKRRTLELSDGLILARALAGVQEVFLATADSIPQGPQRDRAINGIQMLHDALSDLLNVLDTRVPK